MKNTASVASDIKTSKKYTMIAFGARTQVHIVPYIINLLSNKEFKNRFGLNFLLCTILKKSNKVCNWSVRKVKSKIYLINDYL